MHCPSCGQQQTSNETKFCSKCGLPLALVAEVVAQGGFLPQLAQLNEKPPPRFLNKKNGVFFSLSWFIFFALFTTSFFGILGGPDELIALAAITGIFGSMIFLLGSLIFLQSSKPVLTGQPPFTLPPQQPMPAALVGRHQPGMALPPQQTPSAAEYRRPAVGAWRDTNDLQPGSVTEGTTRLLDQSEAKKLPQ
ncbi:MAG: zinc ribbon domain-containing protein [Acidobacteria bacterium]|nr:zinc ribbon domain-containing protein [Acidobacteriota bacterium]